VDSVFIETQSLANRLLSHRGAPPPFVGFGFNPSGLLATLHIYTQ